jgi:hypothetical protein
MANQEHAIILIAQLSVGAFCPENKLPMNDPISCVYNFS